MKGSAAHGAAAEYRGHGAYVLAADDPAEQRELVVVMLAKLGYTAHSVPSDEAAVTFVHEQAVDVVLLDMVMDPGIDGLETYRRIIHIHPDQKSRHLE